VCSSLGPLFEGFDGKRPAPLPGPRVLSSPERGSRKGSGKWSKSDPFLHKSEKVRKVPKVPFLVKNTLYFRRELSKRPFSPKRPFPQKGMAGLVSFGQNGDFDHSEQNVILGYRRLFTSPSGDPG